MMVDQTSKENGITPAIHVYCLNGNGDAYFIGVRVQKKMKFCYNHIIINDSVLTYPKFFESFSDYTNLKKTYIINILDHIQFHKL